MENGTAFFKISPKPAYAVLDSIPLRPHHGYGPPTTDGRPSASGRLKVPDSEKNEGEWRSSTGGTRICKHGLPASQSPPTTRPSGRRRQRRRLGSGNPNRHPRFLYELHPFGPSHATTSRANGQEKLAHQSAQPTSCYYGPLATTPRAETRPSQPTGRRHLAGHFGRLGQIRPPEQASRPLIPF
jgi:hypothetical protein